MHFELTLRNMKAIIIIFCTNGIKPFTRRELANTGCGRTTAFLSPKKDSFLRKKRRITKMKKRIAILLTALMIFSLSACGKEEPSQETGSETFPMTVTDYLGTEMEFEAAPEKIVSLSPSCTEILYALGLDDKMVGVSNWCTYPEEAAGVEKVGDTYSVNVEKIIELDADVVFVSGAAAAESVEALNASGIRVYSIGAKNIDDIYASIENIGTITETGDKAKQVVSGMKDELADLEKKVSELETKSVFIDLGSLYSTGSEDYLGTSLALIKADNIALDAGANSPQLSAETVIEKNPQVYIAMTSKEEFEQPAGFEEIDAFKNGEVYFIAYDDPATDMISRDGPRFIQGLDYLADLIHKL